MPQHFTRNTVSAPFYCGKCKRVTQHRIDDRRKGPCLECIKRLELEHGLAKVVTGQTELFGEKEPLSIDEVLTRSKEFSR